MSERFEKAKKLAEDGMFVTEIGKELGVSAQAIGSMFRTHAMFPRILSETDDQWKPR